MGISGRVTSADGTSIAFERFGAGPPLIMVSGALQPGAALTPWAEQLSNAVTVYTYDRRGRGDSGDTAPYAVEREVEDLAALLDEAGGSAAVYGHSSGAALVLHAAAHGLPIERMVLHEPPFGSGSAEEEQAELDEMEQIRAMLTQDRRRDAVAAWIGGTGAPPDVVDAVSEIPAMQANAPTLLYEYEVTSARSRGGRTPGEQASGVSIPALVLVGGASPEFMIAAGRQIADSLPAGDLRVLDGEEHVVAPEVLVPVLTAFLIGG